MATPLRNVKAPTASAPACRGARPSYTHPVQTRAKSDTPGAEPADAQPANAALADAAPAVPDAVSAELAVERWQRGSVTRTTDSVAEEVPVALVYHDVPHVVMLATPADLEDYAVGFTLSEALVARADEIRGVTVTHGAASVDVHITVAWERFTQLLQRRRNLTGRTGCGLCGAETAADAIRETAAVPAGVAVSVDELHAAVEQIAALQVINARTGSVHAAAWVVPGTGIQVVREDVGRHNALDKTIGALARSGADFGSGFMLMTSRASYELVQKCATVGIPLLVAMSAPTAFAVRLAQRAGITLVAFARRDRHVVYAHPQRLT
jgi:FdhD protein